MGGILTVETTAIVVAISSLLLLYAYRMRKIDISALSGAFVVGFVVLLTVGYTGVVALLLFFVFGTLVTFYRYNEKMRIGVAESHKGMRTLQNVLGNGLSSAIFCVAYGISHNPLFLLGFSGAVATACADTFSTEIGQALCRNPRLITNLKRVPVGTNGGVSVQGLLAALLGSSLIAVPMSLLYGQSNGLLNLIIPPSSAVRSVSIAPHVLSALITISGFFGSIADSIFGATLENRSRLNNHEVNILATLSGGIFAISLSYLFEI
ncbi:MAG: DUF92 domain-containing protein [Canidatus Methanoxibalbensis ujae]|nr:DUF92 domain-containing protein [Candidatus Methanoxibalbensis ujae]MCW7078138.1 DUF92 domain-containing protein [Candidatus Methanoxibalbensis ujae]